MVGDYREVIRCQELKETVLARNSVNIAPVLSLFSSRKDREIRGLFFVLYSDTHCKLNLLNLIDSVLHTGVAVDERGACH